MKKVMWILMSVILISTAALAELPQQSGSSLFDKDKAQKEIEIMKSIIETSLGHARRSRGGDSGAIVYSQGDPEAQVYSVFTGRSSIDGFYLYGQGTSFILSVSQIPSDPSAKFDELSDELDELKNSDLSPSFKALQLRYLESQLKRRSRRSGRADFGNVSVAPLVADVARAVGTAPRAPRTPSGAQQPEADVSETEVADRIAALEAAISEARTKAVREYEEATAGRSQLRTELLETVANHGDSLTHLGNDEYINLILTSGSGGWLLDARRSRGGATHILSVKKSDIRAYKAGTIDLATLTSQVLEYSY